ncbi:MAG TPA: hypothetical protein VJ779_21510 [Acetobacteraceae bacterium]|nr:hypothetical protein [Acetobacteraceae bacterium]
MRALIMAAAFSLATAAAALADQSVAGHWKADLGENVTMDMNVMPDGKWNSETHQGNQTVRRMTGTYTQKQPSGDKPGELVFKPTNASGGNRRAMTERDTYTLANNGQELRLTSGGDTMVFQKQGQ